MLPVLLTKVFWSLSWSTVNLKTLPTILNWGELRIKHTQRLKSWIILSSSAYQSNMSMAATFCIEIWNLKTCFWPGTIRLNWVTSASQKCLKIHQIKPWQFKERRTTCLLNCVSQNLILTRQMSGPSAVFSMNFARSNRPSLRRTCLG